MTAEEAYERFKNLLEVMKDIQLENITATFNEKELKSMIYLLGELIAVREAYNNK